MDFELFEQLVSTQRAIRKFAARPVDDSLIEQVLRAASYAPSAANRQPWRFIVVRDPETKGSLGRIFDELAATLPFEVPERTPWQDVPALIAVFAEQVVDSGALAASIYPAVQNLLLACHVLGLGSVMTTRWKAREAEVLPLLGLPDSSAVYAIVPVGWPDRRYGRSRRIPVRELTFRERLGQTW